MLSCSGNIEMIHPRRKQFKDVKTFHNHPKSPKSQPIQHWSWQCMDFHTLNTLYIIFQDRELSLYCFHVCHFFQKLSVTFVSYSLSDDSLCSLNSLSFFQPNKLRHILKFMPWYTIQYKFVLACLIGRKTRFSRKLWLLYFTVWRMIPPHCICRHSHAPRSFANWRQHGADNWKYFDHLALGLNWHVLLCFVLDHFL